MFKIILGLALLPVKSFYLSSCVCKGRVRHLAFSSSKNFLISFGFFHGLSNAANKRKDWEKEDEGHRSQNN